jgi:hypothetical protein
MRDLMSALSWTHPRRRPSRSQQGAHVNGQPTELAQACAIHDWLVSATVVRASGRHGVVGVTTDAREQPLAEHDVVR